MARWEYLYAEASGSNIFFVNTESGSELSNNVGLSIPDYLNERGGRGWELVSAYTLNASQVRLILKRQKADG